MHGYEYGTATLLMKKLSLVKKRERHDGMVKKKKKKKKKKNMWPPIEDLSFDGTLLTVPSSHTLFTCMGLASLFSQLPFLALTYIHIYTYIHTYIAKSQGVLPFFLTDIGLCVF